MEKEDERDEKITEAEEIRTDHEGRVHDSVPKMCEHWGIEVPVYHTRIKLGWSKPEALGCSGKGLEARIKKWRTDK